MRYLPPNFEKSTTKNDEQKIGKKVENFTTTVLVLVLAAKVQVAVQSRVQVHSAVAATGTRHLYI